MAQKEKKAPEVIRILSVYCYVAAAMLFMLGGLAISVFDTLNTPEFASQFASLGFSSGLMILMGILLFGLSVFWYFVGRGMWSGQTWSRIAFLVISTLVVVGGIVSLFSGSIASGISSTLIYGTICWYLITNKEVAKFFN
jgi:hypothetical protein